MEDKKLLERERNRKQARKSRSLKKECAEKMQQQLDELARDAVRQRRFMFKNKNQHSACMEHPCVVG